MRWNTETFAEKCKRLETWRPWFAWRPVVIDNERIWLEWIFRRTKVYYGGMGDVMYEVEFTDAMSILRKQEAMKDYDGLE
jgi:hypothetical protein